MSTKLVSLSSIAVLMGGTALADVPNVAVDIAPVHSLVARVMEGVGTPDLVIQQGASPHQYNLRPSEAAALQDADLVFWVGPDLTPWMEDAVETLASGAVVTTLLDADGVTLLEFREGALFEAHSHGDDEHDHEHEHDDHDDHAHDDHADDHDHAHDEGHDDHAHEDEHDDHAHDDDHAHEDEHEHDDHAHDEHDHDDHAHEDGHDHAHGDHDPHAWLAPSNAATWLNVIAAQLSTVDPENAGTYFQNAAAARAELEALAEEIDTILDPVRGGSFIVFHDAYQYFETDFDFPASGAISIGDASDPSPARIAEIQARIRDEGVDCVLAEPQFNPALVATVLDGTEANTTVIDPIGVELEAGPTLYPQLIRNLATSLAACF